ncbi:hypothetical protein BDP81DRAFT_396178 [Colletotrichum phormii]|uniref:NmrA-like domain-containing protein n=1 Tax=Colletotrichum phormii TaxID=359342 RepID=A0AAI9ZN02_9PEZI|nr:uncharacterized protein BDP81DRAFT_396178 [Colletotrichum phormii]KAK1634954.1 hypothetical protein BDP81DRAFT_396178 [Colletotrichum phormii]
MAPTLLIIGGTGAQGSEIVRVLSKTGRYGIFVLTRDAKSAAALEVARLPNVSMIEGDASSVADLRRAFIGVDACFVNTNGFALSERDELYWGVRTFEIAAEAGVKHYVYAGLPYVYKRSGYNPKYNVGHLDGKGRVTDFISAQPTGSMNWSVVNSALYLEMFYSSFLPTLGADGKTFVFNGAMGDGSAAMVTLPDLALYTLWVFDNPEKARGLVLDVATEHVGWHNVATAFTKVTGKPAVYNPISPEMFGLTVAAGMPGGVESRFGENGMRVADNFEAFMELHSLAVSGSQGLWTVDYDTLDRILPGRVKSVEEWMRKVDYTGENSRAVLKTM